MVQHSLSSHPFFFKELLRTSPKSGMDGGLDIALAVFVDVLQGIEHLYIKKSKRKSEKSSNVNT